jgi:glyoxylase-like metal-dependent hydrolase (beta-lactamase superfamily II)
LLLEKGAATSLFSGDCVLGCGTTAIDDLVDYMSSLRLLREIMVKPEGRGAGGSTSCIVGIKVNERKREVSTIYPGHGPVIHDPLAKIDEYIAHRSARENNILAALRAFQEEGSSLVSTWEIMDRVYGKLAFFVQVSAQGNVHHHLCKLENEGRVKKHWPDCWVLQ